MANNKSSKRSDEKSRADFFRPSDKFKESAREHASYYLITAFGIIVAFAWNDAFKAFIEYYFPVAKSGVLPQFIYAVSLTVILVVVTALVISYLGREKQKS